MSARKTVLELTQDILSSMDSDEVTSISDTVESQQIVDILEETYYEMLSRNEWTYHRRLEQLESVSDSANPTKIKIPDTFAHIYHVKYRTDLAGETVEKWTELKYVSPEEFINILQSNNSSDADTLKVTTDNGVPIYVKTDRMPQLYTSFDNRFLYFDAVHLNTETTVEQSRTAVVAQVIPAFVRNDTAVPDIPTNMFPYFLNESKSKAFINLRQTANDKVELIARRQLVKLREQEDRVDRTRRFVNYGRKKS